MSARLLLWLALALAAPAASARNESLPQPIAKALGKKLAREATSGVVLRFGKASLEGAELVGEPVLVEGSGKGPESHAGRPKPPTDEQMCRYAFYDAVGKLAAAARAAGAPAVLGIESDYKGDERDDPVNYDCHAGSFHAVVQLKGRLARVVPPDPAYPPSGFASLDDAGAVPVSDAGKDRYRHFLTLPLPRAFVVYEDGAWYMSWNRQDAPAAALAECARQGKRCWLYAVDRNVVWQADVARRIAGPPARTDEDGEEHE